MDVFGRPQRSLRGPLSFRTERVVELELKLEAREASTAEDGTMLCTPSLWRGVNMSVCPVVREQEVWDMLGRGASPDHACGLFLIENGAAAD